MKKKKKVIVILLAYNASRTLAEFYNNFPRHMVDEIILLDDASRDNTYEMSKKLGILTFRNPVNLGYGGNLKKALCTALQRGADVIIDIHPDGEYKPSAITAAIKKVRAGAKLVLGNRYYDKEKLLNSGIYLWKFYLIGIINKIEKVLLGVQLDDLHQGFRVYTKDLLKFVSFEQNSNDYLFSFEIISQAVYSGVRIEQVPVETKYSGKKRGASLKNSVKYTVGTFKILFLFYLAKMSLPIKIFRRPLGTIEARVANLLEKL